eukprot:12988773-Alexandrium_andersonii.AAC.1
MSHTGATPRAGFGLASGAERVQESSETSVGLFRARVEGAYSALLSGLMKSRIQQGHMRERNVCTR